jgi:hypothetical protein
VVKYVLVEAFDEKIVPLKLEVLTWQELNTFYELKYTYDRLCGLVVTNTEVPGSIPGHSLAFFWGSWVWNGVHSAS